MEEAVRVPKKLELRNNEAGALLIEAVSDEKAKALVMLSSTLVTAVEANNAEDEAGNDDWITAEETKSAVSIMSMVDMLDVK